MPIGRLLLFLGFVLSISIAVHWYLARRLVVDLELPPSLQRLGKWFFGALALLLPSSLLLLRALPRSYASPIAWAAFTWMGLMFLLFVAVLLIDIGRFPASILSWLHRRLQSTGLSTVGQSGEPNQGRRRFLARVGGGAAATGALGFGGAGLASALGEVEVKRVPIKLSKLAPTFGGFRIVQLSDIHIGPTLGKNFTEYLVKRSNELDPDVVVITGDLVDGSVEELGHLVAPLRNLRARHGVYFVTGNHEYYSGAIEWTDFVSKQNVRVLRNERVTIERGDDRLEIAGIDDWHAADFGHGHGADLKKALLGRNPKDPVILLAHQPRAIDEASALGVDLQLSGHTHGGQIFPFNYLVRLQQPYVEGLHQHNGTWIYVNRGSGFWGPPMRIGTRSEITLVELQAPRS